MHNDVQFCAAAVQGAQFTAPGGTYSYTFQETAPGQGINPPSGSISQVACTDSGGTPLDSVTYSIIGGNSDPFWLNGTTGQLSWRPGQVLDYENTTSYRFSIMCVNNQDMDQNDTALVVVSVTPVNEYVPAIMSGDLMIPLVVRDSTPVGTVLLSTEADDGGVLYTVEDLDDGPDGQITFTLASQTSSLARLFTLDSNTGALSVARSLIGSAPQIVSGMIIVCDRNRPISECPRLTVIINITIEVRNTVNIPLLESTEVGMQVIAVTCPEGNGNQYGNIVLRSVTPSEYSANFDLNSTGSDSGIVVLRQSLDYEVLPSQLAINITLTCFDESPPTPSGVSFDVIVSVQPVNDVTPQFSQTQYEFTVDMSSNVESVCCVLATDGDRDIGGNITYSLFDAQGRFSIQNNGEITFMLGTLTDKVGTTFVVQVTALDGNFRSTVPATISVIEGQSSSFGVTEIIVVAVCGTAVVLIIIVLLICCLCIRHYTS